MYACLKVFKALKKMIRASHETVQKFMKQRKSKKTEQRVMEVIDTKHQAPSTKH